MFSMSINPCRPSKHAEPTQLESFWWTRRLHGIRAQTEPNMPTYWISAAHLWLQSTWYIIRGFHTVPIPEAAKCNPLETSKESPQVTENHYQDCLCLLSKGGNIKAIATQRKTLNLFTDSDRAGCLDTRKSRTRLCISFGSAFVYWTSLRQQKILRSSWQAQYYAVVEESSYLVLFQDLPNDVNSVWSIQR